MQIFWIWTFVILFTRDQALYYTANFIHQVYYSFTYTATLPFLMKRLNDSKTCIYRTALYDSKRTATFNADLTAPIYYRTANGLPQLCRDQHPQYYRTANGLPNCTSFRTAYCPACLAATFTQLSKTFYHNTAVQLL